MTPENIKKLIEYKWSDMDFETPEGKLLSVAVCVLGHVRFPKKGAQEILDLFKDIYLNPLVSESYEQTFERLLAEKQKYQN